MSLHRAHLERLSRAFSLLLAPLAVGCADESIDLGQFSENLCGEDGLRALDALEPAQAVDYVEMRRIYLEEGAYAPDPPGVEVLDASGQRCGGASDPPACETRLAELPLESEFVTYGFDAGGYHRSLAYTRGDDTGAILTRAQLLDFLGPIDAAGDAALLAQLSGHQFVCEGSNDVGSRGDDFVLHTQSGGGCGEGDDVKQHVVVVRPDGSIEVVESVLIEKGDPNCAVGRLPAGLRGHASRASGRGAVGQFWSEVAHLEAAAVVAFEQLAVELRRHGAPRHFVASALRSRNDEARHAVSTERIARRYGGTRGSVHVDATPARALADVAADNAAEGCIRETYGALVATVQARRAADPVVRSALATIARDETRHAALSWDLHEWAHARMKPAERRRLRRSQHEALDRLEQELTPPEPESVQTLAGMPSPAQARHLFDGLRRTLFA